jgi:hypothetical protein
MRSYLDQDTDSNLLPLLYPLALKTPNPNPNPNPCCAISQLAISAHRHSTMHSYILLLSTKNKKRKKRGEKREEEALIHYGLFESKHIHPYPQQTRTS